MNLCREIVFALILFVFCQLVNNTSDSSQYCDLEKYCTGDGPLTGKLHIGCTRNYNTSKSNFKVLKLKYNQQNFIVNELNQFRSDVALGEIYGKKLTSSTFSYMKKLKWDYELDYLLQLMITKHSDKMFYCISTNNDHKPIQIVMSFKQPQPISLQKVFLLAIEELKSKALQGYRNASQNQIINWSQYYHPDTWGFACAVGQINSALIDKEMVVRCAVYGKKLKKSNEDFKFGELCSGCGADGCSDLFPGLCGSDFDYIRGKQGSTGYLGNMGDPGLMGSKGEKGLKGEMGLVGIEGLKGGKGTSGLEGPAGPSVLKAAKGEKGKPGKSANPENCPGLPGENGLSGSPGKDGPNGATGETGNKGEPAALTKGNKGDLGLSIKGERGNRGNKGEKGLAGLSGDDGMWGDSGDTHQEITVGKQVNCTQGMQGLPGLPGLPGIQGPKGVPPKSSTIVKDVTTEPNREIF